MAESENDSANFWLPSDFLTDDFLVSVTENAKPYNKAFPSPTSRTRLSPRNTGGSIGSTPILIPSGESVMSSPEAEENDEYRDELLAELTRHLAYATIGERAAQRVNSSQEKFWGPMLTSPQSTLTGFASWSNRSNGGLKPPSYVRSHTLPSHVPYDVKEEALELIYAAAGEVAMMKMRAEAQAQMPSQHQQQQQNRGVLGLPCNPSSSSPGRTPVCFDFSRANQMKSQGKEGWVCQQQVHKGIGNNGWKRSFEGGRCVGIGNNVALEQSAWPALRTQQKQQQLYQHHNIHHAPLHRLPSSDCAAAGGGSGMRAIFLGDSAPVGPKKQSTGTGVFLPRTYGGNKVTSEPRKNKGCSTVLLPARVVQALNLNLEEMNGRSHTEPLPCLLSNHHDVILMARRNAILAQQRSLRPEVPIAHPEVLPQDWTY